jgi:hypothetical protein
MRYFFLLSLAVLGCGHIQKISSYTDRYYGYHVDQVEKNRLQSTYTFDLNPQRMISKENDTTYLLVVRLVGKRLYLIPGGQTLFITIDRKLISLSGRGSEGNRVHLHEEIKEETASYKVTKDILREIAYASNVEVRVEGLQADVIGSFKEDNFDYLRKFCDKFCQK